MGHFILSMMLLDAGFALMWCSRYEPWDRRRSWDRKGVWAVRALVPLGQLTILAGTVATGSGPHAGEFEGQQVERFTFMGSDTLEWVVQRHAVLAAIYGFAAIGVWFYLRRPGGDRRALKPLTFVLLLLAAPRRRRLRPVGARTADRDRLGPRRARHLQLAGDAVDDRRRRAGSSPAPAPCAAARARRPPDRPRAAIGGPARARARARPRRRGGSRCSPSGSRSALSASSRASWWAFPAPRSRFPCSSRLRGRWWALVLPLVDRRRDRRDRPRRSLGPLPHLAGADRGAAAGGGRARLDRPRRAAAAGPPGDAPLRPRLGGEGRTGRPVGGRWR